MTNTRPAPTRAAPLDQAGTKFCDAVFTIYMDDPPAIC